MKVIQRRNRLLTMNRILMATAAVIVQRGVENAGINAVALQAGVNKVLLYRYFGGWNGIIEAYFQQVLARIELKEPLPETSLSSQERAIRLSAYTIHYYQEFRANEAWQRLLRWQMINKETELAIRLLTLQDQFNQRSEQLLFPDKDPVLIGFHRLTLAGLTHFVLSGGPQVTDSQKSLSEHIIPSIYTRFCITDVKN